MGASNVTAGKPNTAGAIYWAVASDSITLPENTTDSVSDFAELGYVSEDGLSNSNSPECETIKAWGGDTVLSIQTSKEDTFKFTLIESLNTNVLKAVYGSSNVTTDGTTGMVTITANSDEAEECSWVIDMILKGGVAKRIVIPSATVTEVGEITYSDGDAVGYETTLTCTPDSSGNTHYEYIL